jgi:hypothetical protein
MNNNYYVTMPNGFEDANQQGLNPVFQNIGTQQQYLNQQLSQGNQMAQPTSHGSNVSGLNPLAMAMMLRGKNDFGNSGMSNGMTNDGVTGNIYDNNGQLLTTGNSAPSAATWNQAFGGTGGMDR